MGYVGERLASRLGGLSWPVLYLTLIALYVGLHYFFVSQTSQVLALLARLPRCRHSRRRAGCR